MIKIIYIFLFGMVCNEMVGQTIGLLQLHPSAEEGFTLFSPVFARNTYLIDNCGHKVHEWVTPFHPGQTAFLRSDGSLVRTARIPGSFTGGGVGGRVEIYDWDGDMIWHSNFANDTIHQHHSVLPMDNGNLLVILWIKYSQAQAIQHGFDPGTLTNAGIWSDKIIEIKPKGNSDYDLIWEWDFWDHVIQDNDSSKDNFGIIANHPELLDVNFLEDPGANQAEWIHLNSIDYDESNDILLLSSKFHNEIYLIDHSTTIEEAKSHKGGKYGKGGDLLFRWGNPKSYQKGNAEDHFLFGQHDAQFIENGLTGEGNILVFNNGSNRPGIKYSTVEEIVLVKDQEGNFSKDANGKYLPSEPFWTYPTVPDENFYSSRISGVQRLQNGNTLICEGNKGLFTEVAQNNQVVWQYKNPINNFGPGTQGTIINNNDVFIVRKYPLTYPAFANKTLEGIPIEIGSDIDDCKEMTSIENFQTDQNVLIWPNPTSHNFNIKYNATGLVHYKLFSQVGGLILEGETPSDQAVNVSHLTKGAYILKINLPNSSEIHNFVFLKI